MSTLDGGSQCLLGPVLNRLVDRQHDRLSGMRLDLVTFEGPALAIPFPKKLSRLAADLLVVVLLDTALADLVKAYKPQHVRGQCIVWIKTLRFLA